MPALPMTSPVTPPLPGMVREAGFCAVAPENSVTMTMLLEDVGKLVRAHHLELNACLERWLHLEQRPQFRSRTAILAHECVKPLDKEQSDAECLLLTTSDGCRKDPWMTNVPTHSNVDERASVEDAGSQGKQHVTKDGDGGHWPSSEPDRISDARCTVVPTTNSGNWCSEQNCERSSPHKGSGKTSAALRTLSKVKHRPTCLQKITSSRYYEWFSGTVILLNAIFIGVQTQVMTSRAKDQALAGQLPRNSESAWAVSIEGIFCIVFSLELGLRWLSEGFIDFFRSPDIGWNIMDVVIVFFGVFDMLFYLAVSVSVGGHNRVQELDNISAMRVMRIFRIVRVVRVIRVLRFFRELRLMILSIMKSIKSLVWVVVVLLLTFYLFAVMFLMAVSHHMEQQNLWSDERTWMLASYFGTLGDAILNLFMAMSGGRDWAVYFQAVSVLHVQYRLLFLIFITFSLFAVVNIVTGVFVDAAMESSTTDHEFIVQEELRAKEQYLESMLLVFYEMDDTESNSIGLDEFRAKLSDERVIAYLNAMKLDASDADKLFTLIDVDNSGQLDIHEFATGCHQLQGSSKNLDMRIMQIEVDKIHDDVCNLVSLVRDVQRTLEKNKFPGGEV